MKINSAKFLPNNVSLSFLDFLGRTDQLKAGAIVVLLFLLVLSLAQVRRHFVRWGAKGGLIGLFFGFLLALILEGFLLIGGKTALTEILGWKNPPKPVSVALDKGREALKPLIC